MRSLMWMKGGTDVKKEEKESVIMSAVYLCILRVWRWEVRVGACSVSTADYGTLRSPQSPVISASHWKFGTTLCVHVAGVSAFSVQDYVLSWLDKCFFRNFFSTLLMCYFAIRGLEWVLEPHPSITNPMTKTFTNVSSARLFKHNVLFASQHAKEIRLADMYAK